MEPKLLITTAIEKTWNSDENIIFLGEWCLSYNRQDVWKNLNYEIIPYHWDDRNKLKDDYAYLKSLYELLLVELSNALNDYHQIKRPLRYWRIILAPWLLTYVAVIFDRWECLRVTFEKNDKLKTKELLNFQENTTSYGSANFVDLSSGDMWNYQLYIDIIKSEYLDNCVIEKIDQNKLIVNKYPENPDNTKYLISNKQNVGNYFKKILGEISKNNSVLFYESSFPLIPFLKINLKLKQIPSTYKVYFEDVNEQIFNNISSTREDINIKINPKNSFEKYLFKRIIHDIPQAYVESFSKFIENINNIPLKPKAIFTATAHWNNELFKIYSAEQIYNRGVKLITMEHGGCIPPLFSQMNFEEDIAEAKIVWAKTTHPKHIQLPANKITELKIKTTKKYCAVVGIELPRYSYRIQSAPISGQVLTNYYQTIDFYNLLNEGVKNLFKIRPYVYDFGWNTKNRYIDALGEDKISNSGTYYQFLSTARIIVCTYPQTTFSEAMSSGIPTILLYPEHLYETRPEFDSLINLLKENKIIFIDPKSAAEHINDIWEEPDKWWNSPEVLQAREEFHKMTCRRSSDWLKEWSDFIKQIINE